MKKRFGLDIDGTVTCPTSFISYINKDFNKKFSFDEITQYDLSRLLKITPEQFLNWLRNKEKEIYTNAPLAKKVKETLAHWEQDHELYYISARGSHLHEVTEEWFTKMLLPYDHIELIGKHNKIETIKHHDIDIFFEDKHDNACNIAEECKIPVLLMDTPYNRDPIPKQVIRVKNWTEARKWVEKWL
ncbi:hypothetical protein [Pseudalkalibacillus caeni]|uniref:Nucleotidase n=1 Tax=Exobacillus caeni TaxID=2574798 RepID=A0A5R9F1I2_9BACL|nr:hypothetical protein [Pseudalkalibacillus caeni]TLS36290.1 hypothetical protein FCL54_15235 [Pseudalkalibacillus caeni]